MRKSRSLKSVRVACGSLALWARDKAEGAVELDRTWSNPYNGNGARGPVYGTHIVQIMHRSSRNHVIVDYSHHISTRISIFSRSALKLVMIVDHQDGDCQSYLLEARSRRPGLFWMQ